MDNQQSNLKHYGRFFAMIATSIIVMFFVTYLNSYLILEHAWFSEGASSWPC
ncbi:MAG: hypothetical protein R2856_36650 [Caldilineaceae bacterium]